MPEEDKELPATPKRRSEIREKGQVVKSMDVTNTVLLAAALGVLLLLGAEIATRMSVMMEQVFRQVQVVDLEYDIVVQGSRLMPYELFLTMTIFFVLVFLAILCVQFAQVGFNFSTHAMEPKPEKLNPIGGLKRLFSLRKLVESLTSVLKLVVILVFCYAVVDELMKSEVFLRPVNIIELGTFMRDIAWGLGWRVLVALTAIAILDYGYQKWQFEKDNKMSHQEVKDEFKQTEGNPEVKRKMKSMHMGKSLKRMYEDTADATVVITNPTHYAVALKYVKGETSAPFVLAKGMRMIALRLREIAETNGIPIIENPPLARGLYKTTRIGESIPVDFYRSVAAILAKLLKRGYGNREGAQGEAGAVTGAGGAGMGIPPR